MNSNPNFNRIRTKDMFMLFALYMELYPTNKYSTARKTGCVLVDKNDRILALEYSSEAHAISRAILNTKIDPKGCDMYHPINQLCIAFPLLVMYKDNGTGWNQKSISFPIKRLGN